MEDIVDYFLNDSFIELPGSNQTLGECKALLTSQGTASREKRICYIMRSHQQWWILGEANEAAASGSSFLELSRGPPFKNAVCGFRLFCVIL